MSTWDAWKSNLVTQCAEATRIPIYIHLGKTKHMYVQTILLLVATIGGLRGLHCETIILIRLLAH